VSTRVTRWGNSLAVRIPRAWARELHLDEGAEVELSITEGRLVITPAPSPAYSLAELVAGITPENRHEETDWGKPVGGEVW
jgi:antitoxin MazE